VFILFFVDVISELVNPVETNINECWRVENCIRVPFILLAMPITRLANPDDTVLKGTILLAIFKVS
jgi:hypothetical protein